MSQGLPVLQAQAISLLSLAHAWPRYARAEAVAANGPAQNGANIFHFTCFFSFTDRVRGRPQVHMLAQREREPSDWLVQVTYVPCGVCTCWALIML